MVDNTPTGGQDFKNFLLVAIRAAVLRAQLDANELKVVGLALKDGMVTPDYALQWLADIGLVSQVIADEVKR
jgi:hypothetical protein